MAYDNNLHHPYTSLGWDLHNFGGVFNADMSMVMESMTPFDSEISSGYLQDALIEWRNQCKRRRLISNAYDLPMKSDDIFENYLNWNCTRDLSENFNCLNMITNMNGIPDEPINSSVSSISEGETALQEIKPPEEAISASETFNSSSPSYKDLFKTKCTCANDTLISSSRGGGGGGRSRTKLTTGVVYPFAMVKPGGFEGVVTLNDINERILMPPTRPVRHPVGDFACRPCLSPDGPGLSGKDVVAFTRIHTQGRGTITIIRTRG